MKNTQTSLLLGLLLVSMSAFADIDLSKLNDYSSPKTSGQDIYINNKNLNTGMLRHTTIRSNGDIEGIDAQGDYWYYTKSTNTYHNNGTGRICKGTGALMSECNK